MLREAYSHYIMYLRFTKKRETMHFTMISFSFVYSLHSWQSLSVRIVKDEGNSNCYFHSECTKANSRWLFSAMLPIKVILKDDRCLFFCTFSFGHCVVCPSSIYGFWLLLWYLQTILKLFLFFWWEIFWKHCYKNYSRRRITIGYCISETNKNSHYVLITIYLFTLH